ncbi:unnamed protein product [Mytilus edulis]|uniref:B box-type domain-containing protein n=1 Tax=Mytilus edulis TaxID=6550 RepID=A0A8S3T6H5_MYTED|nr:unnamed protein product [Mytilus edulis]
MALSRSLEKGQTLVLCQFCENDSKITNKCLDCKLLLCAKCSNKLHAMVKGAGDHTIVNIRSLGPQHSVEIKDFKSIKCKQHPTQTACLFCSTCEQSACPACVTKVHKKHNIVDFQDVYQLKVERLHCGQGKVENNYKEIARRDNNLDHIKTEENSRLSNIRESIRDRALLIKSEIDECACRIISEVDVENAKFDRTIQNEHSTLDGIKTHLNGQRRKVQDMIESNDMVQFFEKIVDVTKSIEDCLPPTYSITRELQFLPGLAFHPSVVGEILHENENCEYKPKLEITRKYVSEHDVIQFLTSGPDNSLWYSINLDKKVLEKVTLAEEQLESLSSKEIMVYGLAFVPGYGLLLSTDHETLKIIPENSDEIQDSRFAVDSLEPKCIHVTKDNKLAIGAISKGPLLGSQHSVDFKDFSSIKCEEHPNQLACLFCKSCQQAVCPGCVSKVHKQHNIEEFQNLYKLKVERLQCGIGKVDIDCKELERRSQHLEHLKTMETTRLSNMHQNIVDQATLIKTEIDNYVSRLTTEIEEENTKIDMTIKREQSKMDNTKEKLIDHRQKAQEMKESSNMAEFFAKVTNLTQTMEKCLPPPCSITSGELQLLPGSEVQPNIVGALQHEKINREVKPKMVISKKHVTEETVVQFLTAGPGNSLWYSCNIDEIVLKRVKNFQIISKINLMVYGMVCIPGYGLLISTYGETLKIIPENSDEILDSRFSIDPLEPKCLHMTKDNKLAIGAISKGPLYPASGQRVVILMDMEGNKLSTFEYNQKGKRLLTHPWGIASQVKDRYIQHLDNILMDMEGNKLFTFEFKKNGERLFTHPWGIASTTNGHIFILDRLHSNCEGRLVVLNRKDGSVINIYTGREEHYLVPEGILSTLS